MCVLFFSLLLVKGYKVQPILGNHDQWVVKVLYHVIPTATRHIRLYGHILGQMTLTPVAERLAVELLLPILMT